MKIDTHIQKGTQHPVFCEDFLLVEKFGKEFVLMAVMDGCSGGVEAQFASCLMGKLLRKEVQEAESEVNLTALSTKEIIKGLLKGLFDNLKKAKNQFGLTTEELVSTIILAVCHPNKKKAYIMALGDGTIVIDENIHQFDQQNMPDFMAYHLNEDFDNWFEKQRQEFSISNFSNLAISTDGIDSFRNSQSELPKTDMAKRLLIKGWEQERDSLSEAIRQIEDKEGFQPADDLAIVKYQL